MRLNLDYSSGAISLDNSLLSLPGMRADELENFSLQEIVTSKIQDKKSVFLRFSGEITWDRYSLENVVVEINSGKCRGVHIHLAPNENDDIESVADLGAVGALSSNVTSPGKMEGRSQINFRTSWGRIIIIYDIKVSAANVRLTYA